MITANPTKTIHEQQRDTLDSLVAHYEGRRMRNGDANLAEKVFEHVVENICSGKFVAGQRITERGLASQMSISHVPVREAIEKLQQHGWIERIPKVGAFVKKHNYDEVREICYLRTVIETVAVRIVAKTIMPNQLAELKAVLDLLRSADEAKNRKVHVEADRQFHRLILHFSNSSRLESLFDSIILQSSGIGYAYEQAEGYFTEHAIEKDEKLGHALLYEAIAAHDADRAEQVMKEHIKIGALLRGVKETDLW
jgi:DNA-binding GntR family transcriptional regulator